jgi:hypothetical protein
VRIPDEARTGIATARLSYPKHMDRVTPATVEFRVGPTPAETAARQRQLQEILLKMRALHRQIADLDTLARGHALKDLGENPVLRPPVSAAYNVEEFAPVNARFVRFIVQATSDGSEPSLDELEIYGPGNTDNLARLKGAKATVSSSLPLAANFPAAHLNDGRYGNGSMWVSAERGRGWAQIELPAVAKIARIVWSRDGSNPPFFHDRLPTSYRIEASADGIDWQVVARSDDRAALGKDRVLSRAALDAALNPAEQAQRRALLDTIADLQRRIAALNK